MTRMGTDPQNSTSLQHEELTRQIIGAGIAALNELKPGLDEKLYENALVIEFEARGLAVEQQAQNDVFYKGNTWAS